MPLNYRDVPITLNGEKLSIGGFERPKTVETLQLLCEAYGLGAIISLTDNNLTTESVSAKAFIKPDFYTHGPKVEMHDWWDASFEDAKRIDTSIFDNVYQAVRSAQEAKLKVAIHCGGGDGRTGTALASL